MIMLVNRSMTGSTFGGRAAGEYPRMSPFPPFTEANETVFADAMSAAEVDDDDSAFPKMFLRALNPPVAGGVEVEDEGEGAGLEGPA